MVFPSESQRRVLITGINGFTGQHLERHLRLSGYEVFGLTNVTTDAECVYGCDLMDRGRLTGILAEVQPNYVIHLAGLSHVANHDPAQFYAINTLGTEVLLEALAEADCCPTKIILASSANVYGNDQDSPIHEDAIPKPTNHYAISKLAMECMARNWFSRFPILITRPFNYTGTGQSTNFLVPKIVWHYQQRLQRISLGNIAIARDFSDVRFVAEVYARLLNCSAVSQHVNICSGRVWKLQDIVQQVGDIAGYQIAIDVDSALVRTNEVNSLWGDNSRLIDLIGAVNVPELSLTLRDMFTGDH